MQTTKVFAVSAVVEAGTGLALMIDPALVVALLLGADLAGELVPLGRVAGVALLALGLACWPGRQARQGESRIFRALLTYNALIAVYLAYRGAVEHRGGVLLWPAVALHVIVTILLVWTARSDRRIR